MLFIAFHIFRSFFSFFLLPSYDGISMGNTSEGLPISLLVWGIAPAYVGTHSHYLIVHLRCFAQHVIRERESFYVP
jgi:hypothetical protein